MNDFQKWIAFALLATVVAGTAAAQNTPDASASLMVPLPAPVPATEALATLPDTRLWYWDTGGEGIPVVLVHPATGSALIWGYQQPAFAKAGYRVIGYSRRSYYGSDPLPKESPASRRKTSTISSSSSASGNSTSWARQWAVALPPTMRFLIRTDC
jgi:pimeloyl-ACP methyl ester carboxylesterase